MEKTDFLSLKLMSSVVMVDEEIQVGNKETVSMRGSRMQWPFSNKVSALPQFTPYKTVQEERSKKILIEPLPSPAFMPVSTGDSFDANQKTFNGVVQMKNFGTDRQGGTHYAMMAYPVQHVDTHWTHRAPETGTFYMNNPLFKTQVTTRHNFTPTTRQQPLGGTPVTTQHSFVPNAGSMTVNVDQRNVSKPTEASAQLTIFYGGSVNVYEDVSPEKAHAIMYLAGNGSSMNMAGNGTSLNMAGNGSSMNTNMTTPRPLQVPNPKPLGSDGCHGNQSHATSNCSGLSSPISITSQANGQSGSGSSGTSEVIAVKPAAALTAPSNQPELQKPAFPLGSVPAAMMPAAVPQARKASLARFLEKRKERVMNTMPYTMNKNSPDCSTTPGSSGLSVSENTGVSSGSASKDLSWCLGLTKNNENVHMSLDM